MYRRLDDPDRTGNLVPIPKKGTSTKKGKEKLRQVREEEDKDEDEEKDDNESEEDKDNNENEEDKVDDKNEEDKDDDKNEEDKDNDENEEDKDDDEKEGEKANEEGDNEEEGGGGKAEHERESVGERKSKRTANGERKGDNLEGKGTEESRKRAMGKQSGRPAKKAKPTLSKEWSVVYFRDAVSARTHHIFEVAMTKQKNPHQVLIELPPTLCSMLDDGIMQAIETLAGSAGKGFVCKAHKQGVMCSWDKVPSARKLKTAFLCCPKNG